jgi:hypothetical protein
MPNAGETGWVRQRKFAGAACPATTVTCRGLLPHEVFGGGVNVTVYGPAGNPVAE